MARYELRPIGVWDNVLGHRITRSDGIEWGDYRQWLRAGNVPDPQPVVPPPAPTQAELDALAEIAARATIRDALRADNVVAYLRTHAPAECAAYVNANVTDLASAKTVLSKLAMVVAYLARERLSQ
jgi:hypothetical protein